MPFHDTSIRADIESAQAVKGLLFFGRSLRTESNRAVLNVAKKAVELFYLAAPFKTGRLGRGIFVQREQGRALTGNTGRFSSGLNVAVTVEAKNPKTGFDYVAATRFGHNVKVIRPVRGNRLAFVTRTGPVFPLQVIPRVVTTDWAEAPAQETYRLMDQAAGEVSRRLGRGIV